MSSTSPLSPESPKPKSRGLGMTLKWCGPPTSRNFWLRLINIIQKNMKSKRKNIIICLVIILVFVVNYYKPKNFSKVQVKVTNQSKLKNKPFLVESKKALPRKFENIWYFEKRVWRIKWLSKDSLPSKKISKCSCAVSENEEFEETRLLLIPKHSWHQL